MRLALRALHCAVRGAAPQVGSHGMLSIVGLADDALEQCCAEALAKTPEGCGGALTQPQRRSTQRQRGVLARRVCMCVCVYVCVRV